MTEPRDPLREAGKELIELLKADLDVTSHTLVAARDFVDAALASSTPDALDVEALLRDALRESWAFLDHITSQDYDGEKVDIDVDDLDHFRRFLRVTDARLAARGQS